MKFKTLLFAAVAGLALNAAAEDVQGTITAPNITITDENVGQPFAIVMTLGDLGTISGEEDGYWQTVFNDATQQKEYVLDENGNKIENYPATQYGYGYRIGDDRAWKNIQFNLTFAEGVRPVKVNYDEWMDNQTAVVDDSDQGMYDTPGADITIYRRVPVVTYKSNYDMAEKYPNHIVVGSNMEARPNPAGEAYIFFAQADETLPNGEYDMLVYCKWVDQVDGGHTIYTDEARGVLCKIIVDRESQKEPELRTIAGTVVDEDGIALEGVSVTAIPAEGEENVTATTDADGAYSIEVPAEMTYTFNFALEGYVPQEGLTEEEAFHVVMVKETPAEREITGVVTDAETQAPLAGVTVTAVAVTNDPAGMFRAEGDALTATTGENGAYTLTVPYEGEYMLTFSLEGYETQTLPEAEAANVAMVPAVTGVSDVNAAKAVASVKYYNAAGVASDNAFQGINIVVTKYADGSQSIVKVVK